MDRVFFEKRVRETLRNAAGQRGLSDHLRRLAPDIAALREDGVGWSWIAEILGAHRGEAERCTDHTIRTLWSRLDRYGTASGSAEGSQNTSNDLPARNAGEPTNVLLRMRARQNRSQSSDRSNGGGKGNG